MTHPLPQNWQAVILDDIAKIYDGTHQTPDYVESGIPFYSVEHVTSNDFTKTKYISESVYEQESKRIRIQKGDVLMTRIGDIGTAKYVDWDYPCSFYVTLALLKGNRRVESRWLTYCINSYTFRREAWKKTLHVAFPNKINLGDINKCDLSLPPLPEQHQIVAVLETWDKAIEKLEQKTALKKNVKKGLMQQLLTGKKRLPGFSGEWEEVKLGDVSKIYDGTHQTPIYVEKGIPFYSVEHVTSNDFEDTKFISEEVFAQENKKVKIERGDILMTRIGDIGTAKYIDWDAAASFYVTLALIKCDKKNDARFITYTINSISFQRDIWGKTLHVAFPIKINLGDINRCTMLIPTTKEEQIAIANILSAADQEIEFLQSKLQKLNAQKTYLLNNLITGRIRTPESMSLPS